MSSNLPLSRYVEKLCRREELMDEDRAALLSLPCVRQDYTPNDPVMSEDGPTLSCGVVETGLVSNFKLVDGVRRQVVGFCLPGDAIDLASILLSKPSVHTQAHADTTIAWVTHRDLLSLCTERPRLAQALWLDSLVDADIAREWTANIGQRAARGRIAHLMLEFAARYDAIGKLEDDVFELPLTQGALAEALGLSLVHFNKTFGALAREGCIMRERSRIRLLDMEKLRSLATFVGDYLHLPPRSDPFLPHAVATDRPDHIERSGYDGAREH